MRINLLPDEFRAVDGPPPGRIAVIFVSLILLGVAFSSWLLLLLIVGPRAREEHVEVNSQLNRLRNEQQARRDEIADLPRLRDERAAAQDVLALRQPWSRRLGELGHALAEQKAWVEQLHLVHAAGDPGEAQGPRWRWSQRLDAATAAADEAQVAALRAALLARPGYREPWAAIRCLELRPLVRVYDGYREAEHYAATLRHDGRRAEGE